jgi:hypothetical protein
VAALRFNGYPRSSRVPTWLPQTVDHFSPDNLRRFLIFTTGAPSLPPAAARFVINVQYTPSSALLPIAHTCFLKVCLSFPVEGDPAPSHQRCASA